MRNKSLALGLLFCLIVGFMMGAGGLFALAHFELSAERNKLRPEVEQVIEESEKTERESRDMEKNAQELLDRSASQRERP
jgi:hypothetical protein